MSSNGAWVEATDKDSELGSTSSRAFGLNASNWKARKREMHGPLLQTPAPKGLDSDRSNPSPTSEGDPVTRTLELGLEAHLGRSASNPPGGALPEILALES